MTLETIRRIEDLRRRHEALTDEALALREQRRALLRQRQAEAVTTALEAFAARVRAAEGWSIEERSGAVLARYGGSWIEAWMERPGLDPEIHLKAGGAVRWEVEAHVEPCEAEDPPAAWPEFRPGTAEEAVAQAEAGVAALIRMLEEPPALCFFARPRLGKLSRRRFEDFGALLDELLA